MHEPTPESWTLTSRGGMGRYTEQQKLRVVEDYLSGQSGLKTVAKRHDVDISAVRSWVAAYREHGDPS
ncbi:transposase [Mycetohabitans sp. B2]|uniref:transposase n=1 Tax=Mycetohabitans sp. B2 TaxID=2841274 RepID=UPI003FA5AA5C|nr:transposase [Mycetohabitans sp. B2]